MRERADHTMSNGNWIQRIVRSFKAKPRPGDMDNEHGRRGSLRSMFGRRKRSTESTRGDKKEKPRAAYVPKYASKGHLTSTVQQDLEGRSSAGTHAGRLNQALTLVELEQKSAHSRENSVTKASAVQTKEEPQAPQKSTTTTSQAPHHAEPITSTAPMATVQAHQPQQVAPSKPSHRHTDSAVADIEADDVVATDATSQHPVIAKHHHLGPTSTVPEESVVDESLPKAKNPFRDSALGEELQAVRRP